MQSFIAILLVVIIMFVFFFSLLVMTKRNNECVKHEGTVETKWVAGMARNMCIKQDVIIR